MPRTITVFVLVASLTMAPSVVHAEASTAAQSLVAKAEKAFTAGDYRAALGWYAKARKLLNAPRLVYMSARCLEEMKQWSEAAALYERFVKSGGEPSVVGRARSALRVIRSRLAVGTLALHVDTFGARVHVDGRFVGVTPLPPLELTPGKHEVVVTDRRRQKTTTVETPGGETTVASLVMYPNGEFPLLDAPAEFSLITAGSALTLVGIVLTGVAQSELGYVDESAGREAGRPGVMTQREAATRINDAEDMRTAGSVLMAVGFCALGAGVAWYLLGEPSDGDGTVQLESAGLVPLDETGAAFGVQGSF